jgi:acid stress-induced BolA-like protein IbaG/YrbA
MNNQEIRRILDNSLDPQEDILRHIALDDNAIFSILKMVAHRNSVQRQQIIQASMLLGKAIAIIQAPKLNKGNWLESEIGQWWESVGMSNPFKEPE